MSGTMAGFNVAVAGATGAVGKEILSILAERRFPVGKLHALASAGRPGRSVEYDGQMRDVGVLSDFDFAGCDLALFSAGGSVSAEYAPKAADAGCLVVDNSSAFRYEDNVPLVVAEVNPHVLNEFPARGIVANPNCSTMQLAVALKPLHDAAGISRIIVATYQSVSGAGAQAVEELSKQTAALLSGKKVEPDRFPDSIAFNVIPHIDSFMPDGFTREERKIDWETKKILGDDSICVSATAVRVPVFYGHSEAVYLETREPLGADAARKLLAKAPGVCVIDERKDGGYPTPQTHAAGKDEVFVGRLRDDTYHEHGMHMWVVSDNIRKGAALNAVQLAEILAVRHLDWAPTNHPAAAEQDR